MNKIAYYGLRKARPSEMQARDGEGCDFAEVATVRIGGFLQHPVDRMLEKAPEISGGGK